MHAYVIMHLSSLYYLPQSIYSNEDKKAYEIAGQGEPLSVFASHLLKHINEPVPLIELMMQKVVPSM